MLHTGTVKTLQDKGFGFITREGEEKDLFFHSSELKNCAFSDLRKGDTLEFGIDQGEKGKFAIDVRLLQQ